MKFLGIEWGVNSEKDKSGNTFTFIGNDGFRTPDELTEDNGYKIANSVGEVFFVIDTIAEKVSKLFDTVYITDTNGKEVTMPKNIKKLIDAPNIYTSGISDLIYNYVFSELSDGNGYLYAKCINGAIRVTADNVQQLYWLESDEIDIKLNNDYRNYLKAVNISDYVDFYRYKKTGDEIKPTFIMHSKVTGKSRSNYSYKAQTPLYAVKQNIDSLLASYSARYNSFANNGASGYLCPDNNNTTTEGIINGIHSRDKILADINNRNGITGKRNFWGIASTALRFVNTLGTIKDLMPYDEALQNFLIIAGVYGIDKDLLPLKEGTTFTNKEVAEAKIWNDIAITYANDICNDLTMLFGLKNQKFAIKTETVGFLQSNRKTELEADKIEIENIKLLKEAGIISESDIKQISNKLIDKYGNKIK